MLILGLHSHKYSHLSNHAPCCFLANSSKSQKILPVCSAWDKGPGEGPAPTCNGKTNRTISPQSAAGRVSSLQSGQLSIDQREREEQGWGPSRIGAAGALGPALMRGRTWVPATPASSPGISTRACRLSHPQQRRHANRQVRGRGEGASAQACGDGLSWGWCRWQWDRRALLSPG